MRTWTIDAVAHRRRWRESTAGKDGTVDDMGFTVIVPPAPDADDEWICDLCNDPILTRFGDEPWPVPMLGTYALCWNCARRIADGCDAHDWYPEGDYMVCENCGAVLAFQIDGTDVVDGTWSHLVCACPDCRAWVDRWMEVA